MYEPSVHHREGTIEELGAYIYNEHSNPGIVPLDFNMEELAQGRGDLVAVFHLLCELYIIGTKIYNGLDTQQPLPSLDTLRPSTIDFLAERTASTIGFKPTLTFLDAGPDPSSVAKYRECHCTNRLEGNYLDDLRMGTRLTFSIAVMSRGVPGRIG